MGGNHSAKPSPTLAVFRGDSFFSRTNHPTQSDFPRLAGGTIPFIRRYSTICP
jgi:hypothetical protein